MIKKYFNNLKKKIIFSILFCLILLIFLINYNFAKAQGGPAMLSASEAFSAATAIQVSDIANTKTTEVGFTESIIQFILEQGLMKYLEQQLPAAGSKAFYSSMTYALNKIAYETATYIGSGGRGQKPLFIREGWGVYLTNIADNAVGKFIEEFARSSGIKFNFCNPSNIVKLRIYLGLKRYVKPDEAKCTFTKMKNNWEAELKRPDFVERFEDMFNPVSSDLGIALYSNIKMLETINQETLFKQKDREESGGWLDIRNIDYLRESIPGYQQDKVRQAQAMFGENMAKYTGYALVDAANIFINQLALSAFQNAIGSIGGKMDTATHPYDDSKLDNDLFNFESQANNGGVVMEKDKYRKLLEPIFSVRTDYNITSQLAMCPNPQKAGPSNCVITDKFRQGIENKITVGEAIKQGYLNSNGIFGFSSYNQEPDYKDENYPLRSIMILRKYRILPVGWEIAAQYINNNHFSITTTGKSAYNLSELVACYSPIDSYTGFGDVDGDPLAIWCRGLVDPNWVLKVPTNFCKKMGAGPEIESEEIAGKGYASLINLSRKTDYCADEQSCIREKSDGSCDIYGYCVEERRKYNFNGKECDSLYNTCTSFRTRSGKTIAYLENTLNYGICNRDNVGCKAYATSTQSYATSTDTVTWNTNNTSNLIYLNKNIETCNKDMEGCNEFIRVKEGSGANFIKNSSLEDSAPYFQWWTSGNIMSGNARHGEKYLQLTAPMTSNNIVVARPDYNIDGETYILSFYAKDCAGTDSFKIEGQSNTTPLNNNNVWLDVPYQTSFTFPNNNPANQGRIIRFTINSSTCKIDAVKLERGDKNIYKKGGNLATSYSDYKQAGVVYEKLMPWYIGGACFNNPATGQGIKPDAPEICDKFARHCSVEEAWCDQYTSNTDDITVPAKVATQDYCPSECVGYNTYVQSETMFENKTSYNFIPKTAKNCSLNNVGCEQFTNLDEIGRGAEAIQYYIELKQCMKPDAVACDEFFSWEGSDETGYQLKSFSLKKAGNQPEVFDEPVGTCTQNSLDPSLPEYNPECRQFYSKDGTISIHLYSHTITCSEDCHPYRMTDVYNAGTCKANGEWDASFGACVYMAVPNEGKICNASQYGCREYNGSNGNNTKIVLNSTFENGTVEGWTGGSPNNPNSTSLRAGEHSFLVSPGTVAIYPIGKKIIKGKNYVISFLIRKETPGTTNFAGIRFVNGNNESNYFDTTGNPNPIIDQEWRFYKFNLTADPVTGVMEISHNPNENEKLIINSIQSFYIDDIRLTEITNRYYKIKGSWNTPIICDQDIENYMKKSLDRTNLYYHLGCDIYSDRLGKTHYLKSFGKICEERSVGCEIMINTWNNDTYNSYTPPAPNNNININDDWFHYVVYDEKFLCSESEKGCQRMGEIYKYDDESFISDVYIKNQPDRYEKKGNEDNQLGILCEKDAVGCEEFKSGEDYYYFMDPKDMACEYREATGVIGEAWYKKAVKRCDTDRDGVGEKGLEKICLVDKDCGKDNEGKQIKCFSEDKNIYNLCPVDSATSTPPKTVGFGGYGQQVIQPRTEINPPNDNKYWAGICPASQHSCSEYIDPVSKSAVNIFFNADFKFRDPSNSNIILGWGNELWLHQHPVLEPFTLYRLAYRSSVVGKIIGLTNSEGYAYLDKTNNKFIYRDINVNSGIISDTMSTEWKSILFYSLRPDQLTFDFGVNRNGGLDDTEVELKKLYVDYELRSTIEENKKYCINTLNYDDGCILFNERIMTGTTTARLIYDADNSLYAKDLSSPVPQDYSLGLNNSNNIIKVTPDRVCGEWLACKSAIKVDVLKEGEPDQACVDVGICNKFTKEGACGNFVVDPTYNLTNQVASSTILSDKEKYKNTSGYSRVGVEGVQDENLKGLYPTGYMKQYGGVSKVPNGNFEFYTSDTMPVSWLNYTDKLGGWSRSDFAVINSPYAAQNEKINIRPKEGVSFLRYSSTDYNRSPISEPIELEKDTDYYISAYFNTLNFSSKKNNDNVQAAVELRFNGEEYKQVNLQWVWQPVNNIIPAQYYLHNGKAHDWNLIMNKFSVINNDPNKVITEVKIHLIALSDGEICGKDIFDCTGNIFVDDIKIMPVLRTANIPNTFDEYKINEQTCRLYPRSDSPACEYYDGSGIKYKGQYGYCLQYDRAPGNPNNCLMWYPVDKVKGDGFEEGAGYQGKYPVYYCSKITPFFPNTIYKECGNMNQGSELIYDLGAPFTIKGTNADYIYVDEGGRNESDYGLALRDYATGQWTEFVTGTNQVNSTRRSWRLSDSGAFRNITSFDAFKIKCVFGDVQDRCECTNLTSGTDIIEPTYCSKLVQVVTPSGQNKYWSARTYEGSNFVNLCNLSYSIIPAGILASEEVQAGLQYIFGAVDWGPLETFIPIVSKVSIWAQSLIPQACIYDSQYQPFGSIRQPEPSSNPFLWDGMSNMNGKQPIYFANDAKDQPNVNFFYPYNYTIHDDDRVNTQVQNIFAKSYGTWRSEVYSPLAMCLKEYLGRTDDVNTCKQDCKTLSPSDIRVKYNITCICEFWGDSSDTLCWGCRWACKRKCVIENQPPAKGVIAKAMRIFKCVIMNGPLNTNDTNNDGQPDCKAGLIVWQPPECWDDCKKWADDNPEYDESIDGDPCKEFWGDAFQTFTDCVFNTAKEFGIDAVLKFGEDITECIANAFKWDFDACIGLIGNLTGDEEYLGILDAAVSGCARPLLNEAVQIRYNKIENTSGNPNLIEAILEGVEERWSPPKKVCPIANNIMVRPESIFNSGNDWKLASSTLRDEVKNQCILSTVFNPGQKCHDIFKDENGNSYPNKFNQPLYCNGCLNAKLGDKWNCFAACQDCARNCKQEVLGNNDANYCAIPPLIKNIKVNNQIKTVRLANNGTVNLTFNSDVDSQQLPLVSINLRWGDEDSLSVSGIEMRDRESATSTHSFYHLYNYWDMLKKSTKNSEVYCGKAYSDIVTNIKTGNNIKIGSLNGIPPTFGLDLLTDGIPIKDYCVAFPAIKIKDNWGWCNSNSEGRYQSLNSNNNTYYNIEYQNNCSFFVNFKYIILVTE